MNLPIEQIRVAADILTAQIVEDKQTHGVLDMFRARDAQFPVGLFYDTEFITDLTNITSIKLEVKRATERRGVALMSQTKVFADLDGGLTKAEWDAEEGQHVLFTFTAAETALPMPDGVLQADFWIVISAVRTDGKTVTILAGTLRVYDDGLNDIESVVAAGAFNFRYVAGADDAIGTGFTNDQTAIYAKAYRAELYTNTAHIPTVAADFTGLWQVNLSVLNTPASGIGSPEGVVSRAPGANYRDTATGNQWVKDTGTGNTGWVQWFVGT